MIAQVSCMINGSIGALYDLILATGIGYSTAVNGRLYHPPPPICFLLFSVLMAVTFSLSLLDFVDCLEDKVLMSGTGGLSKSLHTGDSTSC